MYDYLFKYQYSCLSSNYYILLSMSSWPFCIFALFTSLFLLSPHLTFSPSCLCCLTTHILPQSALLYPPQTGPVCQRSLAGRQWGVWASSGRVDACVRETLSHIPPAAGSTPAVRRGFASFSRPLRFLRSSGSYSFPARKQPFPCNCRAREGRGARERGEGLRSESRAWYSNPCA